MVVATDSRRQLQRRTARRPLVKLLVAGARGQVARALVERAAGWPGIELLAIGRPQLDLERPGSAAELVADVAPDIVINAAALTAVDQAEGESARAFRINSDGAGELASAAAARGAPIVQLSTDYVFNGYADGAYAEDAAPEPLNVYGHSKLAGEAQVRATNPRHAIVRTAWLYSPFGRNFVTSMMAAAAGGPIVRVVDDQRGCPTSALDLAEGLLGLAARWAAEPDSPVADLYHLAGPAAMSWCDFAVAIMDECRSLGLPAAEVVPIGSADWLAKATRPRNSALNSCRFERDFGYSMPPWKESLTAVIERISRHQ
jgi:dTDP-4-dehydrorhamnose reductase